MDNDTSQAQITALNKKIERLDARLEELITDYRKMVRVLGGYDDLLNKHCKILEKELADAFERIKHLELTLFPNLGPDMLQLYDIIGEGEKKVDNPLDHRKPDDPP